MHPPQLALGAVTLGPRVLALAGVRLGAGLLALGGTARQTRALALPPLPHRTTHLSVLSLHSSSTTGEGQSPQGQQSPHLHPPSLGGLQTCRGCACSSGASRGRRGLAQEASARQRRQHREEPRRQGTKGERGRGQGRGRGRTGAAVPGTRVGHKATGPASHVFCRRTQGRGEAAHRRKAPLSSPSPRGPSLSLDWFPRRVGRGWPRERDGCAPSPLGQGDGEQLLRRAAAGPLKHRQRRAEQRRPLMATTVTPGARLCQWHGRGLENPSNEMGGGSSSSIAVPQVAVEVPPSHP